MQETQVQSLGQEDPLEEGMATHSSFLAWRIPWAEKPCGPLSMQSQSQTQLSDYFSKPSLWSGESSPIKLKGCRLIYQTVFGVLRFGAFREHQGGSVGEGNGNPLQCSCLENSRDGGAWWAAVSGVAQSQTWLKRLSSSSKEVQCWPALVLWTVVTSDETITEKYRLQLPKVICYKQLGCLVGASWWHLAGAASQHLAPISPPILFYQRWSRTAQTPACLREQKICLQSIHT